MCLGAGQFSHHPLELMKLIKRRPPGAISHNYNNSASRKVFPFWHDQSTNLGVIQKPYFTKWVTHHRRGDDKTYWERGILAPANQNVDVKAVLRVQPIRGWQGGAPASGIFFPSVYYNCDQFANLDFASSEPFRAYFTEQMGQLWIVRLSGTLMRHPASRNF